ncbi:hypothetical protein [Hyphomonas johnsonii]|uniref:DUF465 domain-containing protein n=1 Tax=Hyphomonas johnsonii MHS-2 TaxID=1280950 RepID=A0A059FQT3_9PROT|nr:hypothetical protein [Hyphomonas johnsonii]KCZ92828.1 hypothetical protein HJO_07732 [Hyphomonas johnsonii MHS-2]
MMNEGIFSHRGRLLDELRRRGNEIESQISEESRRARPDKQLLRALLAKKLAVKDLITRRSRR